ncbi:hypothetical protein IGI04_027032 [Brassica rapa subsp. trilocularis]|uniref:Uncharacterized protein n=1 Tax=Brassica rapa subsp. trilocularis TaxID=1813537 RepID=A0ABQ7L081_BRACM|nr:hypothetical protein IGI04_027032 [Brassica rapa subsp. trilocularis]
MEIRKIYLLIAIIIYIILLKAGPTTREFVKLSMFKRTIPYSPDIISSVPYHMNNSISGYRSLIYSGDHDMTVPSIATQAWIKSLNYSIIDDWRPWMIKTQITGYTRTYSNKMTFSTIKGSGHTAEYKPNETFIMFQRWISGQPL